MTSKFIDKSTQKQSIFSSKANYARGLISSLESTVRKDADVKDRDEGIASAILKERSLADALCSQSIYDEIVKIAIL